MSVNPIAPQAAPPWEDPPVELADIAVFIAQMAADHDRPRTSEARWKILRQIRRELGVNLSEVTADQLTAWWFARGTRKTNGAGKRSPATRHTYKSHLTTYYRWAVINGRRDDDPTIRLPSVTVPRNQPRPADHTEVARVVASATGPARRAILLARDCGLRSFEIAQLTRSHLQPTPAGGWQLWVERKGGHRLRVDVPAGLAAELLALPRALPIVSSSTGEPLTGAGVSRLISRTFRNAGARVTGHPLRHLAATELLDELHGDIRAVADQLGHRDIKTTAGYTQPGRSVVDALDRLHARHAPERRGSTPMTDSREDRT